jgi:hypothetical protein
VVIVLPGDEGTQSEMALAVRYGKPVIAFFGDHAVGWEPPAGVPVARTLDEAAMFVRQALNQR